MYLADVPELSQGNETVLASLRSSRWFKRGWTLQELLAPRELVYCNQSWETIGLRSPNDHLKAPKYRQKIPHSDFLHAIVATTGIEEFYLTRGDRAMRQACAAKKLSWAAERETTRPEDRAYCLLGLLNVNMPLLYGEGGSNAFRRLQKEFIQQSDDDSIFAWTQRDRDMLEPCGILAPSPSWFRDAGNIDFERYYEEDYRAGLPYSVTNKGLQLESKVAVLKKRHLNPAGHFTGPSKTKWLEDQIFLLYLNCASVINTPGTSGRADHRTRVRCTIVLAELPRGIPTARLMVQTMSPDFEGMGFIMNKTSADKRFFIALSEVVLR